MELGLHVGMQKKIGIKSDSRAFVLSSGKMKSSFTIGQGKCRPITCKSHLPFSVQGPNLGPT